MRSETHRGKKHQPLDSRWIAYGDFQGHRSSHRMPHDVAGIEVHSLEKLGDKGSPRGESKLGFTGSLCSSKAWHVEAEKAGLNEPGGQPHLLADTSQ